MGIEIKTNKKGNYILKSSISDKLLHETKSVTLEEAKVILAERALVDGFLKALEYFNDFPNGWRIDGKYVKNDKSESFNSLHLKNWNDPYWINHKINELIESGCMETLLEGTNYKIVKS